MKNCQYHKIVCMKKLSKKYLDKYLPETIKQSFEIILHFEKNLQPKKKNHQSANGDAD